MMKFKRISYTYCSKCDEGHLMLNEFGLCADCWAEMDIAHREALNGPPRIVTYRIPVISARWLYLWAMIGGAVGTVVVRLASHWIGW
jgi:hypothetical protein